MADQVTIPEPPDGASVLIGETPVQVFVTRDDASARAVYDLEPDRCTDEDACWWPPDSESHGPYSWRELMEADHDDLPPGLVTSAVEEWFSRAELDQAVADARRKASLTVVGDHLMELGGYCRTHGSIHRPEELARAEDRLEEAERC